MPRSVSCRIVDRDDGLFDVIATIAPDKTYRRDGFSSLAEIEDWIDGLRILMAEIGAPLVWAEPGPAAADVSAEACWRPLRAAAGTDGDAGGSDALMNSGGGARRI